MRTELSVLIQLMQRLLLVRVAVVVASTLVFATTAFLGARQIVEARNRAFLDEMSETALRYVELAVVSANKLLDDLAREVPLDCENAALQSVRLRVYEHSVIKDVRVLTHEGAVRCSAYSETLEFDRDWPSRDAMLSQGGSDAVRLFRVQQFTSDALGVFRDIDDTRSLAAIVAIDPLQLDLLPTVLRAQGQISLELANGEIVAASKPIMLSSADLVAVDRISERFPAKVAVRVARQSLDEWNRVPTLPLLVGSGLLGAFFGLLAARVLGRPVDAAEAIASAIKSRAFRPFYQPIFSLADRRILGCEVLMRWVLADGRVLPPAAFIPLAESTGQIEAMTWQVLVTALAELRDVMRRDPEFKVSVNIVPRHFLSASFQPELRRIADEMGASNQIVLELTERDELSDIDRAKQAIATLRDNGFRFALDDVGVGHSGLSHIQSLRPDTLKIDKFFIDALGMDMTANVVVDMLVRLAKELGMSVVAEGVETELQVAALQACGVHQGQGYLVSPPVPLASFLALVEAGRDNARTAAA